MCHVVLDVAITGEGTIQDYETVLSAVVYQNSQAEPFPGPRTVRVSVFDGLHLAEATLTLNVMQVNDVPILLSASTTAITAQGLSTEVGRQAGIVISDNDLIDTEVTMVITLDGTLEAGQEIISVIVNGAKHESDSNIILNQPITIQTAQVGVTSWNMSTIYEIFYLFI